MAVMPEVGAVKAHQHQRLILRLQICQYALGRVVEPMLRHGFEAQHRPCIEAGGKRQLGEGRLGGNSAPGVT